MQVDDKKYAEMVKKAEHDDKMREVNKKSYQRRNARIHLMLEKAAAKGIKVTEAEVDEYLKG